MALNLLSMPRKANQTSFQLGHVRSPESIEKQRQTLIARGSHPTNAWTEESKAKMRSTKRAKALGRRRKTKHPYWLVMTETGYRYEHRVVMERVLGRALLRAEHVHHVNHDTLDNRPENLRLVTPAEHAKHHHAGHAPTFRGKGSMLNGRWSRNHDACLDCGTMTSPHVGRGLCHPCYEKRRRHGRL